MKMPVVGEIATFAFGDGSATLIDSLKDQGWLACEGQSVDRAAGPNGLPELFKVIGTAWGCDGPDVFNVPDLRGEFLRGWNHGRGSDPDAAGRHASINNSGAKADNVGSAQDHLFASHNHGIKGGTPVGMMTPSPDYCATHPAGEGRGFGNLMQGGTETRPRNVYVMYCIFTGGPLPPQVKFFAN
jgi:microcystin-dependent protein